MNRITKYYRINDPKLIKQQIIHWLNQYAVCCFFDNHQYQHAQHNFEMLAAAGIVSETGKNSVIADIDYWLAERNDWIFGHLNYNLKNQLFKGFNSDQKATIPFPEFYFFQPEVVCTIQNATLSIHSATSNPDDIFNQIQSMPASYTIPVQQTAHFIPGISKETYCNIIEQLLQHIHRGDCYEINYCQEWIAPNAQIDPFAAYRVLSKVSPAPFGAFYKLQHLYLLCSSPERYLLKKGNLLFSSPIKGTIARNTNIPAIDEALKQNLLQSAKERSENVMIVDLVRNDFSRICKAGTVSVTELFGIYTYPQVHQMISTITGQLKNNLTFTEILKATFPMGSMTGAPKERVMQLTEQYECFNRGLYAGSVGYFTPEKDFDFNVVIRSLQYDTQQQLLSYAVGSGITAGSVPEQEYEECLLKASAMAALFNTRPGYPVTTAE
ncbi:MULTISPECIES: anthranilate synthase component I family protein [Hydrotalea]|uniref:anthranilate synthase component I family protein n=1 Tax=Hydrotalea TaxID=1004300 RepID=UPI00258CB756|nr:MULTISPECIES: anthranilate synthase component I family protein [Hydrotalea]